MKRSCAQPKLFVRRLFVKSLSSQQTHWYTHSKLYIVIFLNLKYLILNGSNNNRKKCLVCAQHFQYVLIHNMENMMYNVRCMHTFGFSFFLSAQFDLDPFFYRFKASSAILRYRAFLFNQQYVRSIYHFIKHTVMINIWIYVRTMSLAPPSFSADLGLVLSFCPVECNSSRV